MRRPEAAFFDLDGTLMDREPLMEQAILAMGRDAGLDLDLETLGPLVGCAWQQVHAALHIEALLGWDLERFLHETLGQADRLVGAGFETRVLEGGRALIERLHLARVPILLVTGSLRREADAAIDHLGIGPFLSGSLASEDYGHGKPHPECYLAAVRLVGLDPAMHGSSCVVFEDSEVGVRAGLDAGLKVIATNAANRKPGDPSHQDLSAAHALVESLTELDDGYLTRVLDGAR